ncbi:MAG: rhodanese-like domain-containing protein [Myxococcales bacterium]|nr:rhodanese-like domain-containing protein [Myxococcales bacterium]
MKLERVSPEQAHRLIEEQGYLHLDVRTVQEFEAGHPEGAYNVPIKVTTEHGMADNSEFLSVVRACFESDAGIVVDCRSGNRSLAAARVLIEAGFSRVVDQRAGFGGRRGSFGELEEAGWKDSGLPVASSATQGRDYASLRRRAFSAGGES